MRGLFVICFVVFGGGLVRGLPRRDDLMLALDGTDTAIVESTVREVRAAVPEKLDDLVNENTIKAFLRHFQDSDGDDNERGYHKTMDDEGAKGYKHFDSYHKKDGDKYGFETFKSFGKSDGGKADAGGHSGNYKEESSEDEDKHSPHGEEGEGDEGKEATKTAYKVIEEVDEDEDTEPHHEEEDQGSKTHEAQQSEQTEESVDDDDNEDNGHYTEGKESDENADEHYTLEEFDFGPKGNSGDSDRYTDGTSGYTYGADDDEKAEEDEEASEHAEEAEEDDDY